MPLKACIFFFLILISTSHPADPTWSKDAAGWNMDGQAVADSESRKSRNGFGAMLLLIDDPKFFEDWKKPEAPKFKTIASARRMVPIHAAILFAGAGTNDDGKANVICDVKVLKPDGSIYGAREGMVATKNPIPSATTLLLTSERLVVRIEPKDPAGTYVVEAVVKDKIKNIDLKLKQSFSIEK